MEPPTHAAWCDKLQILSHNDRIEAIDTLVPISSERNETCNIVFPARVETSCSMCFFLSSSHNLIFESRYCVPTFRDEEEGGGLAANGTGRMAKLLNSLKKLQAA